MRGEFVDLNGARLYCFAAGTRGAGDPIVFVHGFPTSSHLWHALVPLVPDGHRMLLLDLLGFGRSDRPAGRDVSVRAHAERLVALLDVMQIDRACMVGHDIGGAIVQSLAVRHPERVSRILLINSVAFDGWPVREVRIARTLLPLLSFFPAGVLTRIIAADLVRGFSDRTLATHSAAQYLRPFADGDGRQALREHIQALEPTETVAVGRRLHELRVPAAVVWGRDDPWLSTDLAARLNGAIRGSSLELLDSVGHFAPEEAPNRIADTLRELLAR